MGERKDLMVTSASPRMEEACGGRRKRCACAPGKKEAGESSSWGWCSVGMLLRLKLELPGFIQPSVYVGLVGGFIGKGLVICCAKSCIVIDLAKNCVLFLPLTCK